MSATTRLVLLAAGACAVFGVVLKIADRGGGTRVAGAPAAGREAPLASGSHRHPPGLDAAAREPAAVEPEHPGPDAEAGDDHRSEPSASRRPAPTPYELLDANGAHVLSPRARARQARREARAARQQGGSLAVAAASGGGAPALGGAASGHPGGAPTPRSGPRAGGPHPPPAAAASRLPPPP